MSIDSTFNSDVRKIHLSALSHRKSGVCELLTDYCLTEAVVETLHGNTAPSEMTSLSYRDTTSQNVMQSLLTLYTHFVLRVLNIEHQWICGIKRCQWCKESLHKT